MTIEGSGDWGIGEEETNQALPHSPLPIPHSPLELVEEFL